MPASPFRLFEPYNAADKDVYFGRETELYTIYNLLQQTRLLLIYGASGTGKTSLIQAGFPKVFKLTDLFNISVRWHDNINDSLRTELGRFLEPDHQITDIGEAIKEIYEDRWIPIYLVFDQFEEIFTLGKHEERLIFFKTIQQLLEKPLPCKIIFSMREEYIGHLYEYESLVPGLFDKRFRIEPMKDESMRRVLKEMIYNYTEQEQAENIARMIFEQLKEGKQAIHLPYLQVYLHYLYEHSQQQPGKIRFTEAGIMEIGKLGNVLKRFIETILSDAQKEFSQWGLVSTFAADLLDEFSTVEGTKQAGKIPELAKKLSTTEDEVRRALIYFTERKLLRADENDVQRYEPVHDVVAKQIYELRSVENKDFKAFLRQLQNDYERWQREDRNEKRLLVESDVAKADVYTLRLEKRSEYEMWKEYIQQSKDANQRRLEKEKKENELLREALYRSKRNFRIAGGVAGIAVLLGLVALGLYNHAQEQEDIARKSLELIREEQARNRQLIGAFYFYGDTLALAVNVDNNSNYKYGFINKEGEALIDYEYDYATTFNDVDGYAWVQRNDTTFFLDTEGKEYPLAEAVDKLHSNITALDLHNQSLKSLPSAVFQNPDLKVLLLYQNQLAVLPAQLWELKALENLNLRANESLKVLPPQIGALTNLRKLDLNGTSIERIPEQIGKLANLQTLDLSYNEHLTGIPRQIGNLKNLEVLDMSGLSMKLIPSSVFNLKKLQFLDLSTNEEIRHLPPQIGKLTHLKKLDLRDTDLGGLPPQIGELTKLKVLNLKGNRRLKELPPEMGKLLKLEKLNLNETGLLVLPSQIGTLVNLQSLNLSGTRIREVPAAIEKLTKLQLLDLSDTKVEVIPAQIGELKNLQSLNISDTKLREISAEIGELLILQTLDLSSNDSLSRLPEQLWKLVNLQALDLSSNAQLTEISKEIGALKKLQKLSLSYNPRLAVIPKEIGQLVNLQELILSSNARMTAIPKEIGALKKLQSLDLSSNTQLKEFPKELWSLTGLQSLDLSFNAQLKKLPKEIGLLTSLRTLNLEDCPLSEEEKKKLKDLLPDCQITF